jgi:aspartyl-tRNA(Asn)/glutamyl-tRNA(Gln) amidotransferase subunit A
MKTNTVMLEDSILLKDEPTAAGSKILEGFKPLVNATVVDRLSGQYEIKKANMEEFGMGETLSDAVQKIAEGSAAFALCNDIYATYRKQAAENNICYIHPTYGTVSRYGLIPVANSMDQIGVLCTDINDGFALLSKIAGKDEKDGAMFPEEKYAYKKLTDKPTIGLPSFANQESIKPFSALFNAIEIKLKYVETYAAVKHILTCAEFSHNINRYDGIRYGHRAPDCRNVNELYTKTRGEGFTRETKLAAIMGAWVLSQDNYTAYYEKAMKIRRLIKESLTFDGYDIIALPCDTEGVGVLANLAGLPSVSFSYQGTPIQLIANVKNENALLTAWEVCRA